MTSPFLAPLFSWARDSRNDYALPGVHSHPHNAGRIPYAPEDREAARTADAIDPAAVLSRALQAACGEAAIVSVSLAIHIAALALPRALRRIRCHPRDRRGSRPLCPPC